MSERNEYEELANMANWGKKMMAQRDELWAACEYGIKDEYRSILKDAVSRLRASGGSEDWLACEIEKKSNMEEAAITKAREDE